MIILRTISDLLILPNPQYPNTNSINIKVQIAHSMDGAIHTHKYTSHSNRFLIPIRGISNDKKKEVCSFFNDNSGNLITYTDEKGVIHYGYISADDISFSSNGIMFDFDFYFEEINQ